MDQLAFKEKLKEESQKYLLSFTFTSQPISSDSVSLVAFTVITSFAVSAKLCALVISSSAFVLI